MMCMCSNPHCARVGTTAQALSFYEEACSQQWNADNNNYLDAAMSFNVGFKVRTKIIVTKGSQGSYPKMWQ